MTALLNFSSMVRLLVLFSCTVTYIKPFLPGQIQKNISERGENQGIARIVYTGIVVGERLSPYLSLVCLYYVASSVVHIFI